MKSSAMGYETTILNAIFLIISYIIIGIVIPTAFNTILWRPFAGKFSTWMNIITLIIINVMFFVGVIRITKHKIAIFNNITVVGILLAIGCSVLFFLLLDNFLDPIVDKIFPKSAVEYQETLAVLRQSPTTTFIRVCLFAPITEELLMRGYVFTGLQNKYGTLSALLITTILFAILHFNFAQTLSAFIGGLIIGLLYIKTNSLFCCMLAHVLYNSISHVTIMAVGSY